MSTQHISFEIVDAVRLRLDRLIILEDALLLAKEAPYFHLSEGFSAETSGGLLVALPEANVDAFIADCEANGGPAWHVGAVVACADEDERDAFLADDVEFIEV